MAARAQERAGAVTIKRASEAVASEAAASEAARVTIKRAKAQKKEYIRVGIDSLIKRIKEGEGL